MKGIYAARFLFLCAMLCDAYVHASAGTVDIPVTADGHAESVDGYTLINDVNDRIVTKNRGDGTSRGLFEFNLAAVPAGSEIVAAALTGTTDSLSNRSALAEVRLIGFAGDGKLRLSDATDEGSLMGGGLLPRALMRDEFDIGISNLNVLNGILRDSDPNDYLTLRVETSDSIVWNVLGLEATSSNLKPTLQLGYVPASEPSSLVRLSDLPVGEPSVSVFGPTLPVPEPDMTGFVWSAAAGLLVRRRHK